MAFSKRRVRWRSSTSRAPVRSAGSFPRGPRRCRAWRPCPSMRGGLMRRTNGRGTSRDRAAISIRGTCRTAARAGAGGRCSAPTGRRATPPADPGCCRTELRVVGLAAWPSCVGRWPHVRWRAPASGRVQLLGFPVGTVIRVILRRLTCRPRVLSRLVRCTGAGARPRFPLSENDARRCASFRRTLLIHR